MSRINSLARFNEDVPDEVIGGYCACCHEELYVGQEVVVFEIEKFCSMNCFNVHMDVRTERLGD